MTAARSSALPAVRHLKVPQLAFDIALAALVLAMCVLARTDSGLISGWFPALMYAGAVAVRRVCPWAMIGLASAGGVIQLATTSANFTSGVVLALLFATTGFDRDRRVRHAGLAAAAAATLCGGATAGINGLFGQAREPGLRTALLVGSQIAVVAGAAWLVGFVRQQRRVVAEAQVAEQIARVEERRVAELLVHEQERSRIARDMHDVVAHTLAVVVAQAEGARYTMAQRPDLVEGALRTIAQTGRNSLGDVRRLLGELRGEGPHDLDDEPTEEELFERMRKAGLALEITDVGEPRPLAEPQAQAARWVLTEALTNALRHGDRGRPVTVCRTWDAGVVLTVTNALPDGARPTVGGHGLLGIAERVRLAGGRGDHEVREEAGRATFVLRVEIPCAPVSREPRA
jgi:signal transduction histidine kinase